MSKRKPPTVKLIDRLRYAQPKSVIMDWGEKDQAHLDLLKSQAEYSQAFLLDGVIDDYENLGDHVNCFDFPNLIPPFRYCFLESSKLSSNFSMGAQITTVALDDSLMPHIRRATPAINKLLTTMDKQMQGARSLAGVENDEGRQLADIYYVVTVQMVLEYDEYYVETLPLIMLGLNKAGQMVNSIEQPPKLKEYVDIEHLSSAFLNMLAFLLFSISLMNSKNVKMDKHEAQGIPNRGYRRRSKSDFPVTLFQWYTLEIETSNVAVKSSGGKKIPLRETVTKALHSVRGHFADYRKSGLFGKHKGVYWMPEHQRGDESAGTILKDYELVN